jgi:hypothetical protein
VQALLRSSVRSGVLGRSWDMSADGGCGGIYAGAERRRQSIRPPRRLAASGMHSGRPRARCSVRKGVRSVSTSGPCPVARANTLAAGHLPPDRRAPPDRTQNERYGQDTAMGTRTAAAGERLFGQFSVTGAPTPSLRRRLDLRLTRVTGRNLIPAFPLTHTPGPYDRAKM